MIGKSMVVLSLAASLMLLTGGTAMAQSGKDLYLAKGCIACHGPDGKVPLQPAYARLAGQQADYLVAQLKAFKAQERKSAQSSLMWGMAATLSETEMKAIATYLEGVK